MTDLILTLLSLGYTVTFEHAGGGGCFVLLRRLETQELVNCVVGDTPEEALQGALDWEKSRQLGNGTAERSRAQTDATMGRILLPQEL